MFFYAKNCLVGGGKCAKLTIYLLGKIEFKVGDRLKIAILGASGMLGKALVKELSPYYEVTGVKHSDLDVTDSTILFTKLNTLMPDLIINAAAIVNLAVCEKNPSLSYLVNTRAQSLVTEFARGQGVRCIYISTDHYYTGDRQKLHTESDSIRLVNEYARTKYLGECAALAYSRSLVLRTNIIGFRGDKVRPTFAEWAIKSLLTGEKLTLFTDFYTSPLTARQLACLVHKAIEANLSGLYNAAGNFAVSKAEFILQLASKLAVKPVFNEGSVKAVTGIQRAESLGLDSSAIAAALNIKMPTLDEVLAALMAEYINERSVNLALRAGDFH